MSKSYLILFFIIRTSNRNPHFFLHLKKFQSSIFSKQQAKYNESTNHFVVQQQLSQHCKSTILQYYTSIILLKWKKKNSEWSGSKVFQLITQLTRFLLELELYIYKIRYAIYIYILSHAQIFVFHRVAIFFEFWKAP